ncbi:unnamed protein product [Rotaria magnacalcarata]
MVTSVRGFALGCIVFFLSQQVATGLTCYSCTACSSTSGASTHVTNTGSFFAPVTGPVKPRLTADFHAVFITWEPSVHRSAVHNATHILTVISTTLTITLAFQHLVRHLEVAIAAAQLTFAMPLLPNSAHAT